MSNNRKVTNTKKFRIERFGIFFTYKQKAIIMKDTLCPFKTLQK